MDQRNHSSLGLLPSASIGLHLGFEPVHGSYPQAAGKDISNPVATILSAAMMFRYAFNLPEEGKIIRKAVADSMAEGFVTEDIARRNSPKNLSGWRLDCRKDRKNLKLFEISRTGIDFRTVRCERFFYSKFDL